MSILTVKQAAERLQVARATVYGLCAQKKLAHIRVGAGGRGTIRIPEESLTAFMAGALVQTEESSAPRQRQVPLKHLKI